MTYGHGLKVRERTDHIVIHTAETYFDQDVGSAEINRWHVAKGWQCIGYHRVVRRDGTWEQGRADDVVGAHVLGHNLNSVGIVLMGGLRLVRAADSETFLQGQVLDKAAFAGKHLDPKYVARTDRRGVTIYEANYTPDQLRALFRIVRDFVQLYPNATVLGHRDLSGDKRPCPLFDVKEWWNTCNTIGTPLTVATSLL